MRRAASILLAILCRLVLLATAQDKQQPVEHEFSSGQNPAFDQVEPLADDWVGTVLGKLTKIDYGVMSTGSSVSLVNGDQRRRDVSVFNPDRKEVGNTLLLRHEPAARGTGTGDGPESARFCLA